jgi:hypothetical protein
VLGMSEDLKDLLEQLEAVAAEIENEEIEEN